MDATINVNHGYPLATGFFPSVVDRTPPGTAPKVQLSWRRRGAHRSFWSWERPKCHHNLSSNSPKNLEIVQKINWGNKNAEIAQMANWLNEHWFIVFVVSIWTAAGNQLWRWQLVTICNFSRACLKGRPLQCTGPWRYIVVELPWEKNMWCFPFGWDVVGDALWDVHPSPSIIPLSGVAPQGVEVVGVINLVV